MSAQLLKVGNTYNLKRNYWLCDSLSEITSPNPGDLALTYNEDDKTKTKMYIYSSTKEWKEYGEGNIASSEGGSSAGLSAGLSEEEIKALILENTNELCFQLVNFDMENETFTLKYTPEEVMNKIAKGEVCFFLHKPCEPYLIYDDDDYSTISSIDVRLMFADDYSFWIETYDGLKYGETYSIDSGKTTGIFYFTPDQASLKEAQTGDVYVAHVVTSSNIPTGKIECHPMNLTYKFENLQSQINELTKKLEALSNS